jgi:hypothetical protein
VIEKRQQLGFGSFGTTNALKTTGDLYLGHKLQGENGKNKKIFGGN